jgi:hypothetical protein
MAGPTPSHHRRPAHAGARLGGQQGPHVDGLRTNTVAVTAFGSWTIYKWGWRFSGSQALDEAYVPFFGAFGAARDDAMVARWSADPLGMLWPEMDTALLTRRRPPAAAGGRHLNRVGNEQYRVAWGQARPAGTGRLYRLQVDPSPPAYGFGRLASSAGLGPPHPHPTRLPDARSPPLRSLPLFLPVGGWHEMRKVLECIERRSARSLDRSPDARRDDPTGRELDAIQGIRTSGRYRFF